MNIAQNKSGFFTPYDLQMLTVSTAVVTLDAAKLNPQTSGLQRDLGKARAVHITVHAQSVRYMITGADPVAATTGHVAVAGAVIVLANMQIMKNFKVVREGGTDAQLAITFLR